VPQTIAEINLNLPTCFNGYLPRAVDKLKEYRFHTVSYSPSTTLIAEHSTEAFTVTSFPGQPIIPISKRCFKKYVLTLKERHAHTERNKAFI